ncbi:GntR family transcriptional regulator [Mesorhizobium sp. LHD-90]|uniref:GntR family transcriptional regulator n=1 Tax=Mesorhizobium sp. LHD-90 TaxID=3071414 RepID=UPI0027E08BA9|nr:GntR family transcriptional regulator [Mesorhizobium sp. LHD-90]MDQ6438182.1 GntR family transcriptional regulator [Mesorhizobium sp. LHD-90]
MDAKNFRVERANETVRARTVDALRNAILANHFKPGDRLLERELCELTGVSRTSVREALRQLETEGLVEILVNRGPVVAVVDELAARDIFEMREAIETMAARLFVQRASEEEHRDILAVLEKCVESARARNRQEMLDFSERFSEILFAGCKNGLFANLYKTLRARLAFLRMTMVRSQRDDEVAKSINLLNRIISAIQRRDPEAASLACAERIKDAAEVTLPKIARLTERSN